MQVELKKFLAFMSNFPQNYSFCPEDELTLNIFNEKDQYVGDVFLSTLAFVQNNGTIITRKGEKILSIEIKE